MSEKLTVTLDKRKMYVWALAIMLGCVPAGIQLLNELAARNRDLFDVGALSCLIAGGLYFASAFISQPRHPVLVLRDDGFIYYPPAWPLRGHTKGAFTPWTDLWSVRFTHERMSGGLDLYARRLTNNDAHVRESPEIVAQIPLSFITISKEALAREIEDRAGKYGVVLH